MWRVRRSTPRSLWTGSISFGLVNVPVRVFSAVHEHKLRFHLVHAKDDGPIGYEKVCKVEDKPVPNDEIVKAFEYEKGEFVQLTDEDFEAVQVEGQHTIDLEDFVPYEQIDPTFFAHAYLVGPQDGAERPYSLLVHAMEESGPRRHRQVRHAEPPVPRLPARPRRRPDARAAATSPTRSTRRRTSLPGKLPSVDKRELDMATQLIESFSGDWKPEKYEDTYTDALKADRQARSRRARRSTACASPRKRSTPDLMEALRRSLEQSRGGRRANGSRGNGEGSAADEGRAAGAGARSSASKAAPRCPRRARQGCSLGEVTLDEATDHLYGVDPDAFVAERTRLARELQDAGDRSTAERREAAKPTVAAWALNQLARRSGATSISCSTRAIVSARRRRASSG